MENAGIVWVKDSARLLAELLVELLSGHRHTAPHGQSRTPDSVGVIWFEPTDMYNKYVKKMSLCSTVFMSSRSFVNAQNMSR